MKKVLFKILCCFIPSKEIRKRLRYQRQMGGGGLANFLQLVTGSLANEAPKTHYKHTRIFIISYNRLTCLKKLIFFLECSGYYNINIIDNASTFPPLLDYLLQLKYRVFYMEKNYGSRVIWTSGKFSDIINNSYYVVTDPDILPISQCPDNFLAIFYNVLEMYPEVNKVGFSLKIDDLPDHYELKHQVIKWEKQYYKHKIPYEGAESYKADIDTTFALYRPLKFQRTPSFYQGIRVGFPYQARHLPWYADLAKKTDEDMFYLSIIQRSSTTWVGDKTYSELEAAIDQELCTDKSEPPQPMRK